MNQKSCKEFECNLWIKKVCFCGTLILQNDLRTALSWSWVATSADNATKSLQRKRMNQLVSMDGQKKNIMKIDAHLSFFSKHRYFNQLKRTFSQSLVWELGGSIFQLPWSCFPHCFAPFLWPFLIFFGDGNVWKPETHIKMWALIRLQASHQKAMCWVFLQPFMYVVLDLYKHFGILRIWNLTILTKKMICKLKLGDIHILW